MYELVSFHMRSGGPAVWGKDFQAAVTAHDAPGYGRLVGAFHNEYGLLNRGTLLNNNKKITLNRAHCKTCTERRYTVK